MRGEMVARLVSIMGDVGGSASAVDEDNVTLDVFTLLVWRRCASFVIVGDSRADAERYSTALDAAFPDAASAALLPPGFRNTTDALPTIVVAAPGESAQPRSRARQGQCRGDRGWCRRRPSFSSRARARLRALLLSQQEEGGEGPRGWRGTRWWAGSVCRRREVKRLTATAPHIISSHIISSRPRLPTATRGRQPPPRAALSDGGGATPRTRHRSARRRRYWGSARPDCRPSRRSRARRRRRRVLGVQRGDADANLLAAARRRLAARPPPARPSRRRGRRGQRAEPADVVGTRPRDHARHAAKPRARSAAAISVPKTPGPMFWSRRATSA